MFHSIKKRSAQERTAAEKKYVAKATRRRRRISQARFFVPLFSFQKLFFQGKKKHDKRNQHKNVGNPGKTGNHGILCGG